MKRIIIVDDIKENRYLLRHLLVGHGFEVEEARHGAEALLLARRTPPDLIVSDLLMPVMDGYTLLRHVRNDPKLSSTPFLVYSGTYTDDEDKKLAFSMGADRFVAKPTEPEAMIEEINATLRAGPSTALPSTLESADKVEQSLQHYARVIFKKLDEKQLELEQTRQDLAAREERLHLQRGALEAAANGIVITDSQGRIEWTNPAFSIATGYTAEEVLGKNPALLKSGTHEKEFYTGMWETIHSGRVWQGEMTNRRKDGSLYIEDMTITPIRDGEAITHFVAIKQDITDRKRLEQQFLRAQRMESIGTLAGGIAHDLNNILTPILMSADFLKEQVADDACSQVIATIESSARRGADMIRQVLLFARGQDTQIEEVFLTRVIEEIQLLIQETFPKNINLRVEVEDGLPSLTGNPTQLHQVLLNMCLNARDAMPDGGSLHIRVRRKRLGQEESAIHSDEESRLYLCIEIEDDGTGIPQPELEQVFDPFFTTKPTGRGTGLGLSTAHGIVKSHGGFIQVDSECGKGTRFSVYLPVSRQSVELTGEQQSVTAPNIAGKTVLIADDEASIRLITGQTLKAYGCKVLNACDGAEAIALFTSHPDPVDLALLDMSMPVMDGLDTAIALRKINPDLPVIIATGNPADQRVATARAAGYQFFIDKPYTANTLLSILGTAGENRSRS